MITLKPKTEEEKKTYLFKHWTQLNYYERFVFTKLITGSFRIGVSQKLMTRALAKATDIDKDILAYKLMGNWDPKNISFQQLILEENESDYLSKPYPFYLAYALDSTTAIQNLNEWCFEHKWDGIRGQVIIRKDEIYVWSRGEELVTDKYPEFQKFKNIVPNGTVIDGEILPFTNNQIGSFNDLQTRIGRKTVSKSLLAKTPVILKAYDILEWEEKDIRSLPFSERRKLLEQLFKNINTTQIPLQLSKTYQFNTWEGATSERERSREIKSEGLMVKHIASPYQVGRKKGGRRSNLFTDYTFGLWNEKKELVTFAKAYSGLTDKEFKQVDSWIKKNTLERFGPVRSVTPKLVFEIAFEGIATSKRHKSGIATRFPRILRWRQDKKIEEANS